MSAFASLNVSNAAAVALHWAPPELGLLRAGA